MSESWISILNYNLADIINSLYLAAENYDYYPAYIHLISTKTKHLSENDQTENLINDIVKYYDVEPDIQIHRVTNQFDLQEIQAQLDAILTSANQTGSISIDLTGEPAILNAFLFYIAANGDREYDHIFYCSREPPKKEADFLLNDLQTDYELNRLGGK